ncbi:MAG: flagellar basal body P-ring protein FlgI, partial [Rickettsiales bacterium]|nr:flagellar basal body P-ring protein FlgI [Rickettsiales bacterium]
WVLVALIGLTLMMILMFLAIRPAQASVRIKDIVAFEGIRDNVLMGYGLVVGLNGTGDKLNNTSFTEKSLEAFLERLGISTKDTKLKTKNVAAVTVTATLPPFARVGSRINVTVSTLGDAKSLQGGVLLATPLMAADGEVYAVAQGAVMIGGFEASGGNATISRGVPTNGFLADGAIVEREVGFELNSLSNVKLALRNPDVSTARRIADAINGKMGKKTAAVLDPGTVEMQVPEKYQDKVAVLMADIEHLEVEPDQVAKVVIDEASGTIVMGENVKVDTVAVAQGNLVVKVQETEQVSQPGAFAPEGAETVTTTQTSVSVDEGSEKRLAILKKNATLHELVGGLNALGVGPRDLINILHTIKVAGALQAEIETR